MTRLPRPSEQLRRKHPAERPLGECAFDDLLAEAGRLHGQLCPGQVLGVRMALAGCREVGVERPRSAGKSLVVLVEIDRCATDAIQALTGVTLGKRTLKHLDYGKTAATFVNMATGTAVRVAARESARAKAAEWAPSEPDARKAQILAYRHMPERELLALERVTVKPGWLDRRRVRVYCDCCGEGINYEREVHTGDRTLCRPCSGESYLVAPCERATSALEAPSHRTGA
ncbi:MAG: formylmethanofuran dehydrogenase [Candidatus Rokubacteria bacterium]|nr:formylmethanofuran dehydrogenase [Candidatus Rokubacteria bacterium]